MHVKRDKHGRHLLDGSAAEEAEEQSADENAREATRVTIKHVMYSAILPPS